MNATLIKQVPKAEDIIKQIYLDERDMKKVQQDREEIKNILEGKDKRLIVIVGPCSAWPDTAVLEYAKKLKNLEEKLKDKLKIMMRVYTQKPRTTKGWTGPINQPDPFGKPDVGAGIYYVRKMMVQVLKIGLPIADELLFTHNMRNLEDLLSWGAIGARSAEDQEHRILASSMGCAVGLKNPTSGSIEIGVNGIVSAQHPHTFVLDGWEVETSGNPHAHLVLRGGHSGPNYSRENIEQAIKEMQKHNTKNPAIIIDASHDNTMLNGKKDYKNQITVIEKVLEMIKKDKNIANVVKGVMLESFIKEGNQKIEKDSPLSVDMGGLSVTDACLGWEQTEQVLKDLAEL